MAGYNLITDDSEALQAYLNNITNSTPLSLEEEKKCYRKFNRVLCVSSSVKNAFDKKYNIENQLLKIII